MICFKAHKAKLKFVYFVSRCLTHFWPFSTLTLGTPRHRYIYVNSVITVCKYKQIGKADSHLLSLVWPYLIAAGEWEEEGVDEKKVPARGRRRDNTFTFASCTFNCPRGITTHRKPKIKSKNQMKKKKIKEKRDNKPLPNGVIASKCVCVSVLSVCEHYSVGLKDLCRLVVDLSRVCAELWPSWSWRWRCPSELTNWLSWSHFDIDL